MSRLLLKVGVVSQSADMIIAASAGILRREQSGVLQVANTTEFMRRLAYASQLATRMPQLDPESRYRVIEDVTHMMNTFSMPNYAGQTPAQISGLSSTMFGAIPSPSIDASVNLADHGYQMITDEQGARLHDELVEAGACDDYEDFHCHLVISADLVTIVASCFYTGAEDWVRCRTVRLSSSNIAKMLDRKSVV